MQDVREGSFPTPFEMEITHPVHYLWETLVRGDAQAPGCWLRGALCVEGQPLPHRAEVSLKRELYRQLAELFPSCPSLSRGFVFVLGQNGDPAFVVEVLGGGGVRPKSTVTPVT